MKQVFFTDRKKVSNFSRVINSLSKNSVVIIREYDLNKKDREEFAKKIVSLARAKSLKIIVGKDFNLAKKVKADGIHFSDFDKLPFLFFKKESFPKNFIFSFSCHNLKAFLRAKKFRPDMVFVTPVFKTSSHVDTKILGLQKFARITVKNQNLLSIYALGGVDSQNLKALLKLGITGFGAIDYFSKNI